METLTKNEGLISQIIGPVIDVEFQQGELPEIYNALKIHKDDGEVVTVEVQQMLGSNKVRTVAMSSTDGLRRGMKVIDTKDSIKIPVGKAILGRILNVIGEPVDELGPVETEEFSLGIQTADCATICFTDEEKIGIAHVGWRGLCLPLIEKMLTQFDFSKLHLFIGPFNHSFEIKKDFCFDKIQKKFGDKYFIENHGIITFLFKDAMMSLLPENIEVDARNTFEDLSLPSFRRDKTSKRLVTVISFK